MTRFILCLKQFAPLLILLICYQRMILFRLSCAFWAIDWKVICFCLERKSETFGSLFLMT